MIVGQKQGTQSDIVFSKPALKSTIVITFMEHNPQMLYFFESAYASDEL